METQYMPYIGPQKLDRLSYIKLLKEIPIQLLYENQVYGKMISLPLPKAGRIGCICHLSDIHIRPGIDTTSNTKIARHTEYQSVIDKTCAFLENAYGHRDDMVICLTGDILDDNRRIGCTGQQLYAQMLHKLSNIAPVYIIRGNHDYNQASITDQDMLSPFLDFLKILDNPTKNPVSYLKDTGVYRAGNVVFGHVAIQDALKAGNTFGRRENLPAFPDATKMPADCVKIALFHGDVIRNYPIDWFGSGYDYILLGDLHKHQIYNAVYASDKILMEPEHNVFRINEYTKDGNKTLWGYPGSLIQQHQGETLSCHGFLMWDLDKRMAIGYHVPNDYGYLTVKKDPTSHSWLANVSFPSNDKNCSMWLPVDQAVKLPWFPKTLRLQITNKDSLLASFDAIETIQKLGCAVESSRETRTDVDELPLGSPFEEDGEGDMAIHDIHQFNEPSYWTDYIRRTVPEGSLVQKNWSSWFVDPNALKTVLPTLPQDIALTVNLDKELKDRADKIDNAIKAYQASKTNCGVAVNAHSRFSLVYMNWRWILCFMDENYFDFQTLKGHVHCISGKNGDGKSSFIQTVFTAMFGEDIPSRTNHAQTASIICQSKPDKQSAMTSIVFEVDGKRFRIKRTFDTQAGNKLQSKDVVLEEYDSDNNVFKEIHSGKTATKDWLDKNVGSSESFLTSCILTQSADADFFTRKTSGKGLNKSERLSQKSYLDQQLQLDSSTKFLELLKVAQLAYDFIAGKIQTILDLKKSDATQQGFRQEELDKAKADLEAAATRLEVIDKELVSLRNTWNKVSVDVLKVGHTDLEKQLTKVKKTLDGITVGRDETHLVHERALLQQAFDKLGVEVDDGTDIHGLEQNKNKLFEKKPGFPRPTESADVVNEQIAELWSKISSAKQPFGKDDLKKATVALNKGIAKNKLALKKSLDELRALEESVVQYQDERSKVCKTVDDLNSKQPPMSSITVEEHKKWLDALAPFQDEYGDIENLASILADHMSKAPNTARSTMDEKQIKREKARIVKWMAEVEGAGVDAPGTLAVEVAYQKTQVETLAKAKDKADTVCTEARKKFAGLEEESKRINTEYTGLLQAKPEEPQYLGKKTLRTQEFMKFTKEQARLANLASKAEVIDIQFANAVCAHYDALRVKRESVLERLEEIQKLVDSCDRHEYDPNCKYCMSHPWKLKLDSAEAQKKAIEYQLVDVDHKMVDTFGRILEGTAVLETARVQAATWKTWDDLKKQVAAEEAKWVRQGEVEEAWAKWDARKKDLEKRRDKANKDLETARKARDTAEKELACTTEAAKKATDKLGVLERHLTAWNEEFNELNAEVDRCEAALVAWAEWDAQQNEYAGDMSAWKKLLEKAELHEAQKKARAAHAKWQSALKTALASRDEHDRNIKHVSDALAAKKALVEKTQADIDAAVAKMECCAKIDELSTRLDNILSWDDWTLDYESTVDMIEGCRLTKLISQLDQAVVDARRKAGLYVELEKLEVALKVVGAYEQTGVLEKERESLLAQKAELTAMVKSLEAKKVGYENAVKLVQQLADVAKGVRDSAKTVEAIIKEFEAFKDWVLENKIIPVLKTHVNRLLALMCKNHRPLELDCVFVDKGDFYWCLKDGKHTPPLEKASGFQQFVVGLAMRIALGRLGVSGIRNTQLFIDEGFTACDYDNLSIVPEILKQLLEIYDAVIIVSHLDDLKHGIQSFINIQRDYEKGLSRIQYGQFQEELTVAKKMGRPRKNRVL